MKRSPIRRESSGHAADRAERRALVKALQDAGMWECQIGKVLRRAEREPEHPRSRTIRLAAGSCTLEPSGLHERRKRSASGSLTTLANLMPACSHCNQWVEREPALAHSLGLVVREGDHEWFMLGKDRWE